MLIQRREAKMVFITRLLLLIVYVAGLRVGSGVTLPQDVVALRSLMSEWKNTPPNWGQSNDPCRLPWVGVLCNNGRVIMLKLSTLGIKGTLSGSIAQLTQLQYLDLSYNSDLGGPLTPNVGNLTQLNTLILSGCSFSGNIPRELGNLLLLSFLALNSNKFSGSIPPSIGKLSNLYWLDIADNQISGPLPISNNDSPGLDLLLNAKHFHFNKNQLSGTIPERLFSSQMRYIHVLLNANNFTGVIPTSIGLVQSLEVLRLDRNSLSGTVPFSISNLKSINELNLANNILSGPIPNLEGMNNLNYVDLSNNTFGATEAPAWFSTMQSLNVLVIESGGLYGNVPPGMFNLPQLEQVMLKNNRFNGTLDMSKGVSPLLRMVNFQNNLISSLARNPTYNETLILVDNPVCNTQLANTTYCKLQQQQSTPYSTNLTKCGSKDCPSDQSLNPQSCDCAYPYEGVLEFRAPSFKDVMNDTIFKQLETSLWTKLNLTPGSVYLGNPFFNSDDYLQVQVKLFPSTSKYFDHADIVKIGGELSSQTFKPPPIFGPYYFIGSPYRFPRI